MMGSNNSNYTNILLGKWHLIENASFKLHVAQNNLFIALLSLKPKKKLLNFIFWGTLSYYIDIEELN